MIFSLLSTDGSDYSLTKDVLTFPSGSITTTTTSVCTTLYIIPDDIEEEDEEMIIHINPTARDILHDDKQQNITVFILNDDGKDRWGRSHTYNNM